MKYRSFPSLFALFLCLAPLLKSQTPPPATPAVPEDNKWWTQEIIVQGKTVTVLIDGKKVVEYDEPDGVQAGKDFDRLLSSGTFALQAHDPKSIVRYRNIRVKRLAD